MTIIPEGTKAIILDEIYTDNLTDQKKIEEQLSKEIGVKCVFAPAFFPDSDLSQVKCGLNNIRQEISDFRSEYARNRTSDRTDHRTLNGNTLLKSVFCLFFGFSFGFVFALLL